MKSLKDWGLERKTGCLTTRLVVVALYPEAGAAHFTFPNVEYAAVCWTTPENRQGEVSCRKQSLPTSTGSSSFIFLTPCYSKSSPLFFATNNPGIRMFSSVMRSPFFLEKCL
jgi:hypothetical protein